ncbi:hypothetical protein [Burkholderia sp. LMG 32019]|uniref:hypothetical protein n=1 Tax=Burkholderia sp. LMG 32019 TaxID=3158173 RepID=UPI003C2DC7D5
MQQLRFALMAYLLAAPYFFHDPPLNSGNHVFHERAITTAALEGTLVTPVLPGSSPIVARPTAKQPAAINAQPVPHPYCASPSPSGATFLTSYDCIFT